MRTFLFTLLIGVLSWATVAGQENNTAAQQVHAALRAELAGRAEDRGALLAAARRADPEHAPARWHSGHVRVKKTWVPVEEAQRQAAAHRRLDDYAVRRGIADDRPESQLALAVWCREQRLFAQERTHLMQVLRNQPRNAEALQRLGVRWVNGELLTAQEHAGQKRLEAQAQADWRRWSAAVKRWRGWVEATNPARKAEGLEQLAAIDDPAAVPALEKLIAARSEELALVAVSTLGTMPRQPATDALVRLAVLSRWPYVRKAAIGQLKTRSAFSFVPQLLSGLKMPVDGAYEFSIRPGTTSLVYSFFAEDQHARYRIVRGQTIHRWALRMMTGRIQRLSFPGADAGRIAAKTNTVGRQLLELNERIKARNQRIGYVLATVTGEAYTAKPQSWWEWWREYNEMYAPDEKPVYDSELHVVSEMMVPMASCFPAGTLVWTERGLEPIQQLTVGDRVLSQDQETGELAFQSVIGTTTRPRTPMVKIAYGSETLSATRGHPFWVSGKGWRMARRLKPGELLHGVHGSVPIETAEEAEPRLAYNLIVDKFNTYFVGRRGLLVHDNVLREPTTCVLPGLKKSE